jgi:tRNA (mo5U34)-methyltransferase
MDFSREQLEESVKSLGWHHSMDLGHGVVTEGHSPREYFEAFFNSLGLPDLRSKSVLDIGAWDGFFSFEAERRGAARVVALDHFIWSIDWPELEAYLKECRERGIVPKHYSETPCWHQSELPGKRGYDLAHRVLGSKVETVVADIMTVDLEKLGTFDVVLFLGVLYHMENPLEALKRVAAITKELAVIQTMAVMVAGYENAALCEFYETDELGNDFTNWWAPNKKALEGMCRAAGFKQVESFAGPTLDYVEQDQVRRFSMIARARK